MNMIKQKKKLTIIAMALCMMIVAAGILARILGISFAGSNVGQGDTVKVGNGKYVIISEYDSFAQYVEPVKKSASSVTIPDTIKAGGKTYKVVSIEQYAFSESCNTLKKLTIGRNIIGIGDGAFRYCKKLKSIIIKTTHLTEENVKSGAFYKICNKVSVTVPKEKLSEYKKILKSRGVTGKNQKIKGKKMNVLYDPVFDSELPIIDPEIKLGIDTAVGLRKRHITESNEYFIGDKIPFSMSVKMDQNVFSRWEPYMMDKGGYIQCGVCGRMFKIDNGSDQTATFMWHQFVPINDRHNCYGANNFFGKFQTPFVAWRFIPDTVPCNATFKITLPEGIDYNEGSIKAFQVFTVPMDGYYGQITEIDKSIYQTKVSGKEITIAFDNIKKVLLAGNYHLYIEYEAEMNENATDSNIVEATLIYNHKDGDKSVDFNKVTIMKP